MASVGVVSVGVVPVGVASVGVASVGVAIGGLVGSDGVKGAPYTGQELMELYKRKHMVHVKKRCLTQAIDIVCHTTH